MLSSTVRAHRKQSAQRRKARDKRRKEAEAAVEAATTALTGRLGEGMARVRAQQVRLEKEADSLQKEASRFAARTERWVSSYGQLDSALKELGDVESWARAIEADLAATAAALEFVAERKRAGAAHGAGAEADA